MVKCVHECTFRTLVTTHARFESRSPVWHSWRTFACLCGLVMSSTWLPERQQWPKWYTRTVHNQLMHTHRVRTSSWSSIVDTLCDAELTTGCNGTCTEIESPTAAHGPNRGHYRTHHRVHVPVRHSTAHPRRPGIVSSAALYQPDHVNATLHPRARIANCATLSCTLRLDTIISHQVA